MKTIALAFLLFAGAATIASGIEGTGDVREGRQPLRFHKTEPIMFPYSLLHHGILSGEAHVLVSVDPAGAVRDVLVVGYSHVQFADAAVQAVKRWTYEPARIDGEPVRSQVALAVNFEAQGVVLSIDPTTDLSALFLKLKSPHAYGPCPVKDLDAIPSPLEFKTPLYPEELQRHGVTGSATVEFYIDETGAVRMAALKDADFWELGSLAVSAVEQWKFAPPTRRGKPVLVKVVQRFNFAPAPN